MNIRLALSVSFLLFSQLLFSQISIESHLLLSPENIIKLTYNQNDRIKAAFYKLESAKNNFKLFESEYTQFNPLIVTPKFSGNSDGYYASDLTAGIITVPLKS